MTFLRTILALSLTLSLEMVAQENAPPPAPATDQASQWFQEADRLFEAAKTAQTSNDTSQAYRFFSACIPLFERFANDYPNHPDVLEALYSMGVAYILTGQPENAEDVLSSLLYRTDKTGPIAAKAAWRLGALAYNEKQYQKALPHFALSARETDNPTLRHTTLNYQARCLMLNERIAEAETVLRRLVNDPHEPNKFKNQASLALAHIAATSDNLEEAFALYQAIASREPDTETEEEGFLGIKAQAIVHGGMTAMRLGRTEEGLAMLNEALKNPGLPAEAKAEAQLMLMQHEFEAENFETVQELFRYGGATRASRAETAAEIFLLAGKANAKLGQHNAAVEAFVMVDRTVPNSRLAFEASYRKLLSFYEMRGTNVPESANAFVELYKSQHAMHPWIQNARVMKAETYFSFADYENATEAWELVNFSRLPEDLQGPAFFKSGWALVENGDYNSAIGVLSEFISRYPESPDFLDAVAKRAESYLEVGDRISALADCERILTEKPKTPLAAFALQLSGRLYQEERRTDKMLASYETLLADYNNLSQDTIARANYSMGLGYFDQGDFDTALVHLQKARSTAPEFYEESAGTAIALCYYRLKNSDALRETVSRIFSSNPQKALPTRLLAWLGLQMYEKSNYQAANLYLSIIAKEDRPRETEEGIWKALAKSRLEIPGRAEDALTAIDIVLETEEDPFWRSDAFLDKANALIKLKRWNDAEVSASRGLDLDPQGTVKAGLHLALGDIALAYGNYSPAASSYVRAAEYFPNDTIVQPLALHKAAWCLEKVGDTTAAQAFRDRLRLDHPEWKAPESLDITPGSAQQRSIEAPATPVNNPPQKETAIEPTPPAEADPLPPGISITN